MSNRHILLAIVLLFVLFALSGCHSSNEVEELAIVRAIAIDYMSDRPAPYIITLAVIRPSIIAGAGDGGGGSGISKPTHIFSGDGTTIEQALEDVKVNISRRVFLGHNEIVLVSEEKARHGLQDVTDFIIRNNEMRLTNLLCIVPGIASDILQLENILEEEITNEILGLKNTIDKKGWEADPQEAFQIIQRLSTPGRDTYTSVLQLTPELAEEIPELQKEQTDDSQGGGTDSADQVTHPEELRLAGTAVFRGDKLAGYLDDIETRGFLWMTRGIWIGTMTIKDPEKQEGNIDININQSRASITPTIKNGKISFQVQVLAEGNVIGQKSDSHLDRPETLQALNKIWSVTIKDEAEQTIRRLQDLGSDIVGFGTILNRSEHKNFHEIRDRWPEVFSEVEIEVTVDANLRRTGLLTRPIRINR